MDWIFVELYENRTKQVNIDKFNKLNQISITKHNFYGVILI